MNKELKNAQETVQEATQEATPIGENKTSNLVELKAAAVFATKEYNNAVEAGKSASELEILKKEVSEKVKAHRIAAQEAVFDDALMMEYPIQYLANTLKFNTVKRVTKTVNGVVYFDIRDDQPRLSLYEFIEYSGIKGFKDVLSVPLNTQLYNYLIVRAQFDVSDDDQTANVDGKEVYGINTLQRDLINHHKFQRTDENGDMYPDPLSTKNLLKMLQKTAELCIPTAKVKRKDLKYLLQTICRFNSKDVKGGLLALKKSDFDDVFLTMLHQLIYKAGYTITMK